MTQVLIERAHNCWLLIIQDNTTGKRKVVAIPFQGENPGYQAETEAVQLLMSLPVD